MVIFRSSTNVGSYAPYFHTMDCWIIPGFWFQNSQTLETGIYFLPKLKFLYFKWISIFQFLNPLQEVGTNFSDVFCELLPFHRYYNRKQNEIIETLDYAVLYQHKNIKIYATVFKFKINLFLPDLCGFIHKKIKLLLNQS